MVAPPNLRLLDSRDTFAELTGPIHRAYAPLAARGLRYWGTFQTEADTRQRCGRGECWVAESEGRLVGTITWRHDPKKGDPDFYLSTGVAVFGQFAVDPLLHRTGIGSRLLATAEARAQERGFTELACDTAIPNRPLIDFHLRRGYRIVGTHRWDVTNCESALLGKSLPVTASSPPSGSAAP